MTVGTRPEGLRERKRRATRRALQEAALRLVAEHGLEAVTVEDISAEVEVSSRTFFNYFPTKEDALAGEQSWLPVTDELREILLADPGAPLLADLHRVLRAAAPVLAGRRAEIRTRSGLLRRYPVLLRAAMAAFLADEAMLEAVVAERIGPDQAATGLPRLVAVTTTALLRAAVERWMTDEPGDADQLSGRLDAALHQLRGLLAADGSPV